MHEVTAQRIRYGRIIAVAFGLLCLGLGINGESNGLSNVGGERNRRVVY